MELENIIIDSYLSLTAGTISSSTHDSVARGLVQEIACTMGPATLSGAQAEMYKTNPTSLNGSGQPVSVAGYLGYPALIMSPDFSKDITYGCTVPNHPAGLSITNAGADTMYSANLRKRFLKFTYNGLSASESSSLLAFLEARKGNLERFWVPSWTSDVVVDSVELFQRSLTVPSNNISNVNTPKLLWICDLDTGNFFVTKISVAVGPTDSILNFESMCPWSATNVMVGYMYLVRLSDTTIVVRYEGYGVGSIDLDFEEEIGEVYGTYDDPLPIDRVASQNTISGELI